MEKMRCNVKGKTVYSTRGGDQRKDSTTRSGPGQSLPPAQQQVRVMRDRKGRKGKVVTVASGFALTESDLNDLAKTLKTMCGAGGTVKIEEDAQVIEIQGDHRERVVEKLKELGYKAKPAGG